MDNADDVKPITTEETMMVPVFIRVGPSPDLFRALLILAFIAGMLFTKILLDIE